MAKILCNYFGLSMAAEGKSDFVGRQAAAFLGYVRQDAERCAAGCDCAEDLSAAPEEIKREILRNDEQLRRREQTVPGVEHDVVAIYDNAGIPSIMHRFRRVTNKELFGGSDAVHPAFIIGGEVYDEIYISVYSALKKAGLIEPLTPSEEIEKALTKDQLLALVRERGLPDTGKKRALADRLAGSGYKLNRRKTGGHLFRLTETGAGIVTVRRNDKRAAINRAIAALKERNYHGAVEAYRKYDSKWGFAHTSGKVHTIFAYYDIPRGRFQCIENCAMQELHNTEDFKETLRACLLAGFMRGCQDRWELTDDFKAVCKEEINCPRLLSLFDYEPAVLQNMRQQIEFSADNALEYYISHLLYLSKRRE